MAKHRKQLRAASVERRAFTVSLPLPPRALSPNARVHWAAKAKAVKAYRAECEAALRAARLPEMRPPVAVSLDFYTARATTARERFLYSDRSISYDADNALASAKAALDSLVAVGVVRSDSSDFLRVGAVRLHTRAREHGGRRELVLTIEECE